MRQFAFSCRRLCTARVLCEPQPKPGCVTFCRDNGLNRDRFRFQPKRSPFFLRDGGGQNECVARAGRGDVKQAQFLAPLLAALVLLRKPVRQARIPPARVRRLDAWAQAEGLVKNDFIAQVLCVERLGEIGDGDDGEFQSFALVNAQQPHGVFVRDRRDLRLNLGLALRLDKFQKPEQSLPLKLVKLLRETQKKIASWWPAPAPG